MNNSLRTTQDLRECTVAVQKAGTNRILGTGIIVTEDGVIATCYHVVGNIRTKLIVDKTLDIYFPSAPDIKICANVIEEHCHPELDIAFLQLLQGLPKQVAVAILSETIEPTHTFQSFGFRREKTFDGLYSDGIIQGNTRKKSKEKDNTISLQEVIQLKSDGIYQGMSGAAVLDTQLNRVVGIVSEYSASSSNVDQNLGLANPVRSLLEVYPELKRKNPGLKILEFLRKIGEEGITKYERIDELYVPPVNYDEIKKALSGDRILFIVGTQECGKTYTAVHFLWEYFKNGYEPLWFKGGEQREQRIHVRSNFVNLEKYLKPHHIIYFEDPLGKIEYEVNVDEGIIRNIADIIATAQNVEDAYIVITSRDEVFKNFERRHKAALDLKKFEKKLTIGSSSYDYNKRKEMIQKYAQVMNCLWYLSEGLKNVVFGAIKDERKLTTPLNIQQFAAATSGRKAFDITELTQIINAKSIETTKGFAEEIKIMNAYQILFLSFPFISDWFSVDFVKTKFLELMKELKLEYPGFDFKKNLLDWFANDKIDISDNFVRFSHPSFYDAINFLLSDNALVDDKEIANYRKIVENLSHVLTRLANDRGYEAKYVAATIVNIFDKLPSRVQELIFKLADNDKAAGDVARAIVMNYHRLPPHVQNLLFKLADNDKAAGLLAWTIIFNYSNLPSDVQLLLFKLADKVEAASPLAWAITANYYKLPSRVQELIFKLADNDKAAGDVAVAIIFIYYKLRPDVQELIFKLADNDKAAGDVAKAIVMNYHKLPPDVQELIFKLADNDKASSDVAYAITSNFGGLPSRVQELIFKLADNDKAFQGVVWGIVMNYHKLPPDVQELIFKLADNGDAVKEVMNALIYNYLKPTDVQKSFFTLADDRRAVRDVAGSLRYDLDGLPSTIVEEIILRLLDNQGSAGVVALGLLYNYSNLPPDVQELIFKLADNDKASSDVAYAITSNFGGLPSRVQELIFKLADNDKASFGVAMGIAKHYSNLPPDVQELIFKLADSDNTVDAVSLGITSNFGGLPSRVQELIFKLADNDKAFWGVATGIIHNYSNLPPDVQKLLFNLADNVDASWSVAYALRESFIQVPPNIREQLLVKLADKDDAAEIISNLINEYEKELSDDIKKQVIGKLDKKSHAP